jgi:aspartyl-tRNA(Asn)/glutamyl-tRNA(Gln) amidotransferase subunit A
MRALARELGDRMSPHLVAALEADWTAEQLTTALVGRKAIYNRAWRVFQRYDLLLTPTMPVPAFPHGQLGPTTIAGEPVDASARTWFTCPFNLTGQPAATVPAGWTSEGLPVGLQVAARRFDDALLLRACAAYEAAAPWAHRWPRFAEQGAGLASCGERLVHEQRPCHPVPVTRTTSGRGSARSRSAGRPPLLRN